MKLKILFILTILSLFTYTLSIADNNKSIGTELDSIGIVMGDGNSLNLKGQLRRSEAATIVTKLLGEETHIQSNKSHYSGLVKFSDVKNNQWFSPYIGYLSNKGIINGYQDNTFKPDHYLSEKEMMVMILLLLGYDKQNDFTWNTIYQKAFEAGIVTDASYKTKKEDNTNYLREDCFELVRSALDAKYKNSEDTIISRWIEDGIYTREDLVAANLLQDEQLTEITSTEVSSETTVKVTFNENIKEITKESVSITTDGGATLVISSITINANVATITTAKQTQLQKYNLHLSVLTDQSGNQVQGLSAQFTGYKPQEIISDKFLISKIEPVSKDTIKVYFTQEISAVPTIPIFYDIYDGDQLWVDGDSSNMYIAQLTDSRKGVIIRLTNQSFATYKTYTLKVAGTLTDLTGIRMNNGNTDSMSFAPLVVDNFTIQRESTFAQYKDIVTVEFSKPVDKATGESLSSFQIQDSNNAVKVGLPRINPDNPKQIQIGMVEELTPGEIYKLNILNPVYDLERATSLTETGIQFSVADVASEDLKIALVETVSNSELRVYMNNRLDPSTVGLANFRLTSSNDADFNAPTLFDKLFYDASANPNVVTLYLNPATKKMKSSGTYSLEVTDSLKSYLGHSNGSITSQFTGNGNDKTSPLIRSGVIVDSNTVKIEFDKFIANSNTGTANYKIKHKDSNNDDVNDTPTTVSIFNNKYVILQFSETLDIAKAYRIEYQIINDYREDGFVGGASNDFLLTNAF